MGLSTMRTVLGTSRRLKLQLLGCANMIFATGSATGSAPAPYPGARRADENFRSLGISILHELPRKSGG